MSRHDQEYRPEPETDFVGCPTNEDWLDYMAWCHEQEQREREIDEANMELAESEQESYLYF